MGGAVDVVLEGRDEPAGFIVNGFGAVLVGRLVKGFEES